MDSVARKRLIVLCLDQLNCSDLTRNNLRKVHPFVVKRGTIVSITTHNSSERIASCLYYVIIMHFESPFGKH